MGFLSLAQASTDFNLAVTKAQMQARLMRKELFHKKGQGECSFLAEGLKLEVERYVDPDCI